MGQMGSMPNRRVKQVNRKKNTHTHIYIYIHRLCTDRRRDRYRTSVDLVGMSWNISMLLSKASFVHFLQTSVFSCVENETICRDKYLQPSTAPGAPPGPTLRAKIFNRSVSLYRITVLRALWSCSACATFAHLSSRGYLVPIRMVFFAGISLKRATCITMGMLKGQSSSTKKQQTPSTQRPPGSFGWGKVPRFWGLFQGRLVVSWAHIKNGEFSVALGIKDSQLFYSPNAMERHLIIYAQRIWEM